MESVEELIEKPTKEEKLSMLKEMIRSYEDVPPGGMLTPTTHYDMLSVLLVMQALFDE